MKLAICGSRGLSMACEDLLTLVNFVNTFYNLKITEIEIVSGGAKGIDTDAANLGRKYFNGSTVFEPEYDKYPGRVAPLKRNETIADYSDVLLVVYNGSGGSLHVKNQFKKRNKPVFELIVPANLKQLKY